MLGSEEQQKIGRGLQLGDRTAWAALYEHYSVTVWRLTARLVGPDQSAVADIVQEIFLAAAASGRRFDASQGTLWSWLSGITHRQVSLYWRKTERAGRWRALIETGDLDVKELFEGDVSPLAIAENRELADLVRRVLAELPSDYAIILTAKYLDDQSLADLSEHMGGSPESIKSRLARARREFRAAFEILAGFDQEASLS